MHTVAAVSDAAGIGFTVVACWKAHSALRRISLVENLVEQPVRLADFRIHLPTWPSLASPLIGISCAAPREREMKAMFYCDYMVFGYATNWLPSKPERLAT
jgi:hypothetical protein